MWVAQVMFMTQKADPQTGDMQIALDTVASLPWPLAKALHAILGRVIAEYEGKEGAITVPASFVNTLSGETHG